MFIDLTAEQRAFRDDLRKYFVDLMTPDVQARLHSMQPDVRLWREVYRKIGSDGWLGASWPPEYGGKGQSPIESLIFLDEARRVRAPIPTLTIAAVGPTLMRHGTESQRQKYLPGILRGEIVFAIGYSEPDAGTDLASLRTTAVHRDAGYQISGQKVFTSDANIADYIWLAARTGGGDRHRGISIFIVSTSAQGVTISPIYTVAGYRTNAVFLDEVLVSGDDLVGTEDEGWGLIRTQLNYERVNLCLPAMVEGPLDDVRRWAAETRLPDGQCVDDQDWVRMNLAEAYAKFQVLKLINWKVAWSLEAGTFNQAEASMTKVYGTEACIEIFRLLLEILEEPGYLQATSPGCVVRGRLEEAYRRALIFTFAGGTNEVQREMIAWSGLGVPRSPR
jgi:alkylation response protein AidB-like acyl-CoA dehydrogenase